MKFKYRALNQSGKMESGIIEGEGEAAARQEIRSKALYLVSLKPVSEIQEKRFFVNFGLKHRLPVQFARQLSSLLKGGVPLFQALSIIANQLENQKEKEIMVYLADQVRGGSSLSEALKGYPEIFDELFIYSIQAGEKAGALDSVLTYQAELLEKRAIVVGKIRTALIYPIIMASVGGGVLVFLMVYVVPMVIKIFERMSQKLPIPTRLLIAAANFVNSYFLVFVVVSVVLAVFFIRWARKNPKVCEVRDRFLLRAPLFGSLYRMVLMGRFARILATLLRSGVAMVQSLVVASRAVKNRAVSESILHVADMVQGGSDLSVSVRSVDVFSSYLADMISVGESGGNLDEMLARVADYYEVDVDRKIAAFTAMVEPAIILTMGLVVAFVLVSVLLPLFELNKVLLKR